MAEAGEEARFLAGGQSLVPMMNFRLARPSALVDLGGCKDLAYIRKDGGRLRIGAMTRQADAEASELVRAACPMLSSALAHAGPLTVRNRATVGGSMANAYPLAQLPCVAVCLDAEMVLQGPKGLRTVAAAEFFVSAMVSAIEPGELLREIVFPCIGPSTRHAFRESGNHAGGSAIVVVCVSAEANGERRIAVSGIAPTPVRVERVEPGGYAASLAAVLLEDALASL